VNLSNLATKERAYFIPSLDGVESKEQYQYLYPYEGGPMKAKTKFIRSASPFLVEANDDQTPAAGFATDFQDLCAQAMDRALGIHKASLDSAVGLHSCAIEFYPAIDIYNNQASLSASVLEAFIDTTAQSFAQCMELHVQCMEMHRSWLTLLAPYALSFREVSSFMGQSSATPEDLAHHMDIAIGERHTAAGEMAASHAGRRTAHRIKRAKQSPDESMDTAIGARAA
jgi:hypothetical protein